jgi:hypothetical protein
MARPEGIEPPTLCLEGRRSIRLSYGRAVRICMKEKAFVALPCSRAFRGNGRSCPGLTVGAALASTPRIIHGRQTGGRALFVGGARRSARQARDRGFPVARARRTWGEIV